MTMAFPCGLCNVSMDSDSVVQSINKQCKICGVVRQMHMKCAKGYCYALYGKVYNDYTEWITDTIKQPLYCISCQDQCFKCKKKTSIY